MRVLSGTVLFGVSLLGAGLVVGSALRDHGSAGALSVAGLVMIWWGFAGPWLQRFAEENRKDDRRDRPDIGLPEGRDRVDR